MAKKKEFAEPLTKQEAWEVANELSGVESATDKLMKSLGAPLREMRVVGGSRTPQYRTGLTESLDYIMQINQFGMQNDMVERLHRSSVRSLKSRGVLDAAKNVDRDLMIVERNADWISRGAHLLRHWEEAFRFDGLLTDVFSSGSALVALTWPTDLVDTAKELRPMIKNGVAHYKRAEDGVRRGLSRVDKALAEDLIPVLHEQIRIGQFAVIALNKELADARAGATAQSGTQGLMPAADLVVESAVRALLHERAQTRKELAQNQSKFDERSRLIARQISSMGYKDQIFANASTALLCTLSMGGIAIDTSIDEITWALTAHHFRSVSNFALACRQFGEVLKARNNSRYEALRRGLEVMYGQKDRLPDVTIDIKPESKQVQPVKQKQLT